MSVAVGDVDTLMSHTISDCQSREAHVNQEADVGMSQIVDSDALNPGFLASSVHFPMQIVLAYRENAAFSTADRTC